MLKKNPRGSKLGLFIAVPALFMWACTSVTAPLVTSWEGTIQPIPPNTLRGRAAAVTQFGRTRTSIVVERGDPEVTYGWRIDSGSCQEQGEIQGGGAAYPFLEPSEVGTASADVTLATQFKNGKQFSARVFVEAAGGADEVVACGELVQLQ